MNCEPRAIFRAEAMRRYAQGQERIALPPTACPHAVFCLWVLLGLLLAAGGFTSWIAQGVMSHATKRREISTAITMKVGHE